MSSKPSLRVVPSKPQVWGQRCNDNTLAPFSEVPGSASAAVTWGAFSRHIRHKHFMIVSYDTLCIKNKDHLINSWKFRLNRCSCIEMYRKNTKCTIRQKGKYKNIKKTFPLDSLDIIPVFICLKLSLPIIVSLMTHTRLILLKSYCAPSAVKINCNCPNEILMNYRFWEEAQS